MTVIRETLKNINIDAVVPYKNNPVSHKNNKEHIKNSLQEFGYIKTSIVVNEDNTLLAGHGTLMAMKELGWTTIPEVTKVTGLSKQRQKQIRIADNSTSHASEWDISLLDIELSDIGIDMKKFGIDTPEKTEKKITKQNIQPFNRSYILISFLPEKMLEIEDVLKSISLLDGIEIDVSSN